MTLDILYNEMIKALKERNTFRKNVLSSLVDAVKKAGINNNCRDNIPEELVNSTLQKEQKTVQEMIDTCPPDREETLKEYKAKMEIVKEFAPQMITDHDEIFNLISKHLAELGIIPTAINKGNIMKNVMPKLKGKVDMGIANKIINTEILK